MHGTHGLQQSLVWWPSCVVLVSYVLQELQEERMANIGNPAHKRETLGDMVGATLVLIGLPYRIAGLDCAAMLDVGPSWPFPASSHSHCLGEHTECSQCAGLSVLCIGVDYMFLVMVSTSLQ
jgi:hypothetical protein